MSPAHQYRFLEFTYDAGTGELKSSKETTRLQPQPATALRVLLENAGQLVSRETLKQTVWPDTVVETDQGLNFCVRQIRIALGEDAEGARFIETLPRRGYRFIAPVEIIGPGFDVASEAIPNIQTGGPPRSSPANRKRYSTFATLAIVAVLMIAAAAYFGRADQPASDATPITVAILPLATAEGDSWAEAYNAELTEALVTSLTNSQSPHYGVVGPATTASLVQSTRQHTELGRELNVSFVLSGGVRLSDSTMFVQLIRVSDGVHVFAWRQPVNGSNAVTLADSIAKGIALKVQ